MPDFTHYLTQFSPFSYITRVILGAFKATIYPLKKLSEVLLRTIHHKSRTNMNVWMRATPSRYLWRPGKG